MYSRYKYESKVEELFRVMQNLSLESNEEYVTYPDTITYHIIIKMFLQSKNKDNMPKTLHYLKKMMNDYDVGELKKIQLSTFNAVIIKMMNNGDDGEGTKALDILSKIE